MTVFVKIPGQETITLTTNSTTTVQGIKEKLFDSHGIPVRLQTMRHGGRGLDSQRTLAEYQIENYSTLYSGLRLLGGRSEEELQVYVQTVAGTTFLVTGVFLVEQVKDFKTLIPISSQRLTFGGVVLEDHELLRKYGIVNGSMLEVLDTRVKVS